VKDIGDTCFIDQRAVASQLRELKKKGYVVSNEVGRESFYELREVLMRFCMEVKKFRGRWVELIVDFLKVWYRPDQRLGMLEKFGDSKLMARNDLEQAFLSEDDPVATVCMKELCLSLKQRNKGLSIKLAEEIHSLNFFSDAEYHRYISLLSNERYDEILILLSSAKTDDEQGVQSLYVLLFIQGWMFSKEKKWVEAVDSFDRALAIKPDKYEAWFNRGNALDELERYKEAILSYDRAIAIKPDRDKAWFYRGDSFRKLGKYQEAVASFDRAVAINSNDFEAWFNRGVFMNDLGKYEEAIASFDRALAIKPENHQAWFDRGTFLYNLGKYEEAIASFDRAITVSPNDEEAWFNRGIFLCNLGKHNEAVASFNKSIDINSSNRKVWYIRGVSMIELYRYQEAVKSFDRAISIIPEDYDSWYSKGVSLFCLGEYPESIACYDQVIAMKPNHYDSWHKRGLVQFVIGGYNSTLIAWKEAFEQYNKNHLSVFPHHNVTKLIQEFIEELIPRFTQPPIQQTFLIPLLKIYKDANVITELGAALVNTLHLIVAPTISDHTAAQWLALWRTSSLGHEPAMELPLRLMSTAIEYKKDPSKRQRLWLNLPSEERPILDQALKLLD
jgi:tetratricopeptide (TPR) repeat protein